MCFISPKMELTKATKTAQINVESPFQPSENHSLFLNLPLEIRRQIYDTTLGLALADQLSLLRTNRQICEEGRDFLFRRPLTCASRENLQKFVRKHDPVTLEKVRYLELRLQDLHPTAMQPYLEKVIMGIIPSPTEHPYFIECNQILSCLQMMPNIRHLSILHPRRQDLNPPPRDLIQQLLSDIPHCLKRLQSLSVKTELKSLDFIVNLPQLRSLSLAGCFEEEPRNARNIVKHLTTLRELNIIGPPELFLKQRHRSVPKRTLFALTPDVLHNIQPLTRLSIRDLTNEGNPTFFTRGMLIAVFNTHRRTLESWRISSLLRPSNAVLELLKAILLTTAALYHLQLEWPDMDPGFLVDCLPPSIQVLTATTESATRAQDVVDRLTLCKHRIPYLKELKFNLVNPTQEITVLEKKQQSMITEFAIPVPNVQRLRSPWKTKWSVWQPASE